MLETQDLKDFSIATWYEQFQDVAVKTYLFEITSALLEKFRSEDFDFEIEEICTLEYVNQIKNTINTLGNEAFVKNNWHAPTDAKFISFGNLLKVTSINDILMYITASDIIINDLANDKLMPFYIALKPWINIHPATEFRCIVINDILRGISPRDWPTFYGHFAEEGSNIIKSLSRFFDEHIQGKFSRKNCKEAERVTDSQNVEVECVATEVEKQVDNVNWANFCSMLNKLYKKPSHPLTARHWPKKSSASGKRKRRLVYLEDGRRVRLNVNFLKDVFVDYEELLKKNFKLE